MTVSEFYSWLAYFRPVWEARKQGARKQGPRKPGRP